jgi:hypothetical protein
MQGSSTYGNGDTLILSGSENYRNSQFFYLFLLQHMERFRLGVISSTIELLLGQKRSLELRPCCLNG